VSEERHCLNCGKDYDYSTQGAICPHDTGERRMDSLAPWPARSKVIDNDMLDEARRLWGDLDVGRICTELQQARARIAELEAAEKRDVADEVQTEADWKQERERMEGEIQRLTKALEDIEKHHVLINGRVGRGQERSATLAIVRAALGKTV